MTDLPSLLEGSPYQGYSYSYPHKTSYRPLGSPVSLAELWSRERRDSLFLYIHIPFCEMRCGFCNLFTQAKPEGSLVERYLRALERQARRVRDALGDASFARLAVGGGTPTFLEPEALETALDLAETVMGARLAAIPFAIEVSPGTVTSEKLSILVERGASRVSIGVETFVEDEARAVNRAQETAVVERALGLIRDSNVRTLNIDLIYGLPTQTVASWLASVRAALRYRPEELYLYPLYVRPQTTLGRADREWDDLRLLCYREGRALLLAEGYTQVSMRMFRAAHSPPETGPAYRCQEDGMVGIGCGARSYATELHYSDEYAVRARGVRAIIEDYVSSADSSFGVAEYGHRLEFGDLKRRFVIQSLLSGAGLSIDEYTRRFGGDPLFDLPELLELPELGLASTCAERMSLTECGLERSDVIGPWLYSERVRSLMEGYAWR